MLVAGSCDKCPFVANPDQGDTNNDGIGDACCCIACNNVDWDNGVNVDNLTYLVDYLFRGSPPPPVCP
jgi:hypothetical protein